LRMSKFYQVLFLFALSYSCYLIEASQQVSHQYSPSLSSFESWMHDFGKVYVNGEEKQERYNIWLNNWRRSQMINLRKFSWTTHMNRFADLSAEEFQNKILMKKASINDIISNSQILTEKIHQKNTIRSDAPDAFDWRDYGVVTSVKDQGTVGSCWAFSTVGNIEGQWALAGNELVSFSPEFLVDCDGTTDRENGRADCGVFGGWPYLAYQFIIETGGIPTEESYPYCSGTGDCFPCMLGPQSLCGPAPWYCNSTIENVSCPNAQLYGKINNWFSISQNETEIKQVLYETGPLSALLDASELQLYKSGIWTGLGKFFGCGTSLDHAVLLVGYGQEDGKDYWTVKNSWGDDWGENGYFRIERGTGMCGINTFVTSSSI